MSCFARVIKLILRLLIVHQCNVEQLKHKNIAWSYKFTTFLLKGQPGNILTYQLMPKLIVANLFNCKNFLQCLMVMLYILPNCNSITE